MKRLVPFQEASIVITGLIRNGESTIRREISNLSKAFSGFKQVTFLVIESDSSDSTIKILDALTQDLPNFTYKSLGILATEIPDRIDRIAFCREFARNLISLEANKLDYVCVADLDGVNNLLTRSAVESCWQRTDWDVVTANQTGPYYDIYALRADGWCPGNAWEEQENLVATGIHPMKARKMLIFSRQKVISAQSEWIGVDSAFGGLAIYTASAFALGRYSGRDSRGKVVCEHVIFNMRLRRSGMAVFINPKLINSQGNHLRGIVRRVRFAIKYTLSFLAPKLFMKWIG